MVAVTPGENLTANAIQKLLAGDKVEFPGFQRSNNLDWAREEITMAGWRGTRCACVETRRRGAPLPESNTEPVFGFGRGRITIKKQSMGKLAQALLNWMRKIVVDETGLKGLYNMDLEYGAETVAAKRPEAKGPGRHS